MILSATTNLNSPDFDMSLILIGILLKSFFAPGLLGRCLKFVGLTLLGVALTGEMSSEFADAAIVQFRSSVVATSGVVKLGDIADIREADSQVAARLAAIEVCPAPAAGRSRRIDFDTIRGRLASRGINLAELEFSGDSVVQVSGPEEASAPRDIQQVGSINPNETAQLRAKRLLEQAVIRFVKQQAPQVGAVQVTLRLDADQSSQLLTAAGARLQVAGGRAPWLGAQEFVVRTADQRGADRQFSIRCAVTPLPRIPVTRFSISKGQVLKEEDLVWQQVEKLSELEGALTNLQALVGQETRRSIRPGKPITPHDIRTVPMIRTGELISVYSKVGGVVAQTTAKAAGDGGYGELIQAHALAGRDRLVVRVAGYHKAFIVTSEETIRKDQQEREHDAETLAAPATATAIP